MSGRPFSGQCRNKQRIITQTVTPTDTRQFLLPHQFRMAGYLLLCAGTVLTVVRFYYGLKLAVFDLRVFAVYSSFLQTKCFTFIENNFTEEIAGLLLVLGFSCIVFSREKIENDAVALVRLRAFILSLYLYSVFLVLSLLFVFGIAFVKVMILETYLFYIVYIPTFAVLKYRNRKRAQIPTPAQTPQPVPSPFQATPRTDGKSPGRSMSPESTASSDSI